MADPKLYARLDSLPPKVQRPLRELLSIGQLSEDTIEAVLDATDLAGSTDKALAFTAAFLYLESKGVPVKAAVRMARNQGRRICLQWSPRRWRDEYDRLRRAEILMTLSENRVLYNVADIAAALPARFRGYLIRDSRRLGMEGLRQRHCVTNQHHHLCEGLTAIASIFIHQQRWTVELMRHEGHSRSLKITQIRGRFNKIASHEVVEAIHRELGISLSSERMFDAAIAIRPHLYLTNLRRVLPLLRSLGIRRVTVTFDGDNDDDSTIESVEFDGPSIDEDIEVMIATATFENVNGEWVATGNTLTKVDLHDALTDITEDCLADIDADWRHGAGSYGTLKIDVDEGTVALEIIERIVRSQLKYSLTCAIQTGAALVN